MTSTFSQKRQAEKLYSSGYSLFQRGLYSDALIELRKAEDAFRIWDARGHPFAHHLSNGVSGLANTLVVSGACYQRLGNFKSALTCYETSLINAKFEKQQALRDLKRAFAADLIVCYEKMVENGDDGARESFLSGEPEIDISLHFPYSLPPDVVPFARLYELAPERYAQYKDCYQRVKEKDAEKRRQSKISDDSAMKRMSVYVWGLLLIIWVVYGYVVMEALHGKKN